MGAVEAMIGGRLYRVGLGDGGDGAIVGKRQPGIEPFVRDVAAAVRRVAPQRGYPAQPTDRYVTAHAILSSGWFDSDLDKPPHANIFGVKKGSWTGPVAVFPTGECYDDAEIARAQATPPGTAGAFIKFLADTGRCPPGKRRVLILDRFRSYGSVDAALGDYFDRLALTRYTASAAKLRAGAPDFMRQLGLDGWYTGDPDAMQGTWWSVADRSLPPILAEGGGVAEASIASPGGGAGIAVAVAVGLGLWALSKR